MFLLRCHTNRIAHTASLTHEIAALQGVLREGVGGYRTLVGTNIAALRYAPLDCFPYLPRIATHDCS